VPSTTPAIAFNCAFFPPRSGELPYVDIVREGQTVLTRDLDIENGQAELTLTATPEMAGTVDFNAYLSAAMLSRSPTTG